MPFLMIFLSTFLCVTAWAQEPLPEALPAAPRRYLGVALHYAHMTWPARTVQVNVVDEYNVNQNTSTTAHFSVFADLAWSSWRWRPYIVYRKTHFVGTAQLKGLPQINDLIIEQTLGGFGLVARKPLYEKWWWGVGTELAMGLKATTQIKSTVEVNSEAERKPIFAVVTAHVGTEYEFGEWALWPEFKVGAVISTLPAIWVAEVVIAGGWKF